MFPHLLMNTQVKSFHNLFGFTKYLLHKIRCFWTLYSINKKQHFWSEYFFEFKFIFCYYGSIFLKDIKIKTAKTCKSAQSFQLFIVQFKTNKRETHAYILLRLVYNREIIFFLLVSIIWQLTITFSFKRHIVQRY